jgi:hypothetical protein
MGRAARVDKAQTRIVAMRAQPVDFDEGVR